MAGEAAEAGEAGCLQARLQLSGHKEAQRRPPDNYLEMMLRRLRLRYLYVTD